MKQGIKIMLAVVGLVVLTVGFGLEYYVGFESGYKKGHDNGYENGFNEGENVGFENGFEMGYQAGFENGFDEGQISGYNIHDPTYAEMRAFLGWDNTDQNIFTDNYQCHQFTLDVIKNAQSENIRCAYVRIDFPDNAHAIVAFNTTDNGLIYIEPQNDAKARVIIGENYLAWGKNLEIYCSDNAVTDVTITWPYLL